MPIEALPFPRRINVEPTNLCNMRCRLCPHPRMSRPKGTMSLDIFRRIAEECAQHGSSLWLQYMGEPLLHPRIIDMVRLAKQAGVGRVGLSTNALLLDEEMAARIVASGLDRLECSVDAVDEATFLQNRGSPHYRRVVANIEGFLAYKQRMAARTPVTSIQYMSFVFEGRDREEEIVRFWEGRLGRDDFIMSIRDYSFAGSVRAPDTDRARLPCLWVFRYALILWDGTLAACGSDFDGRGGMGNVGERSIAEIWQGEGFRALRNLHREGSWDAHPLCRGCDDWILSDGSGYVNILKDRS